MAIDLLETLKEAIIELSPNTFFTLLAITITLYYIVSVLFGGSSDHQHHRPTSSEEDRSTVSSQSSSHSIPAFVSQSWKHEVFLSFRGEDTRKNFVDHLYAALVQQGIQAYKDDEILARGERIGPTLLKAIQESRIAVIVFSENYADSSWCLDELAHIMECMDTRGQIVEPIFYHVEPSDVRKQKGKYGEAFSKHKRENKHEIKSWRKALEKAGNLSGWVINDIENSHEAKCIKDIVGTISDRLPTLITNVNKDLIGIETRLQDLRSKLEIGSDGVRIVGIWGVGGGGKTTLASAAYAEISDRFEALLEKLQEKFLSLVLKTNVVVGSVIEGRSMIERRLHNTRVLVVLDDVDNLKQLEALAGSHAWFGEGSRIIITTRDEHLLTRHADKVYEVSLLSHDEAIELFSKHAYRKDKPIEDYETLSKDVVSYAGGLPLALEVLGSFLYDKEKDEWQYTLAKLKDTPDDEVTTRLKISYDGLKRDEQELFLDIACCLRGEGKREAMIVLDACGFHSGIGIRVLIQKSLIKVSNGKFDMHDLIEEMAHYIVRGERPKNPQKQSRIWKGEDIAYLCDMGADAPPMETEVITLRRTTNHHVDLSNTVANMKKLRWIELEWYLASSFPSNFQPTELRCLQLHRTRQKELWHGYKRLPNLKILDLSYSKNLIRTPDFDGLPCLERLILESCSSLVEIHPSIGYHKRLVFMNIASCLGLERFPPITQMKKLETFDLSFCHQLQQFPDIQSNINSLVTLDLRSTGIQIIPPSVGQFCTNLVSFDLSGCQKLKRIEVKLHLLKNLTDLCLHGCSGLQSFHGELSVSSMLPQYPRSLRKLDLRGCNLGDGDIPSNICELSNLQVLNLSCNKFSRLPSNLSPLRCLKYLNLSYCKSLVELPALPSSVAILRADGLDSLESVGDFSDNKWLWKASLWRSNKFTSVERVSLSMLEVNAAADRFMLITSRDAEPSSIHTRLVTLQLPHNWYSDFSGFQLVLRDFSWNNGRKCVVIKQEMSTDHYEKFDKDGEQYDYVRVGYVPFSSLRHIPWLNPTYTKSLSFQTDKGGLSVELVGSRGEVGDLNERPINYSECWDEENANTTFDIIYDSKSSEIQVFFPYD